MGTRRKAREAALQFLFQEDFCTDRDVVPDDLEGRFALFAELYGISQKAREYALLLLRTIVENRGEIDAVIRESLTNWRLERIAATDRNLLRIGVCEMILIDDVPVQVAINEAVEIAKRYGGEESPPFLNGVLDAVREKKGTV